MTTDDRTRIEADHERGQQYIADALGAQTAAGLAEAAAPYSCDHVAGVNCCGTCECETNTAPATNLTDALFGPYTCTACPSYGHPTSMHKTHDAVPLADRGGDA